MTLAECHARQELCKGLTRGLCFDCKKPVCPLCSKMVMRLIQSSDGHERKLQRRVCRPCIADRPGLVTKVLPIGASLI